jgi:hypothetical protein
MKARTLVAGVVHQPHHSTRHQSVDAHELVPGSLRLQEHSIAFMRRSILTRWAEEIEATKKLADNFPGGNGLVRGNTSHNSPKVSDDRESRAFLQGVAAHPRKRAVIRSAKPPALGIPAARGVAVKVAPTTNSIANTSTHIRKLPMVRVVDLLNAFNTGRSNLRAPLILCRCHRCGADDSNTRRSARREQD